MSFEVPALEPGTLVNESSSGQVFLVRVRDSNIRLATRKPYVESGVLVESGETARIDVSEGTAIHAQAVGTAPADVEIDPVSPSSRSPGSGFGVDLLPQAALDITDRPSRELGQVRKDLADHVVSERASRDTTDNLPAPVPNAPASLANSDGVLFKAPTENDSPIVLHLSEEGPPKFTLAPGEGVTLSIQEPGDLFFSVNANGDRIEWISETDNIGQ